MILFKLGVERGRPGVRLSSRARRAESSESLIVPSRCIPQNEGRPRRRWNGNDRRGSEAEDPGRILSLSLRKRQRRYRAARSRFGRALRFLRDDDGPCTRRETAVGRHYCHMPSTTTWPVGLHVFRRCAARLHTRARDYTCRRVHFVQDATTCPSDITLPRSCVAILGLDAQSRPDEDQIASRRWLHCRALPNPGSGIDTPGERRRAIHEHPFDSRSIVAQSNASYHPMVEDGTLIQDILLLFQ